MSSKVVLVRTVKDITDVVGASSLHTREMQEKIHTLIKTHRVYVTVNGQEYCLAYCKRKEKI